MLQFSSKCRISIALTKQPSAYYLEYLREFCENIDSLPPKETMRAGLETMGLVDEKNPNLSCTGNILFSDLVAKLINGKKGREPNVCYIRFLSLIIEHLLGEGYKNYKLTTFKPYHILAASFKTSKASEVALISHMLKVVNISIEHEQTLILSSEKVNANNITNKSLYGTAVQSIEQPKTPTGRKPKKKKIPSSSERKNSHYARRSKTKETVINTQHTEESVATVDTTQSLNASESGKELKNRLDTVDAEMVIV
ncbi:hypothetical protein Tco_1220014 [Tanacetum coccineum]